MRTFIIGLITTIMTSSLLFAGNSEKEELLQDMRSMLSAMEMIQMAGLYNDGSSMQQGIAKLEKSITKLKTDKIKSLLPKESQYAYEFAKKRAKMIDMYVKDLADNASKHMVYDALESYSQILRQCTSCHERVRTTR